MAELGNYIWELLVVVETAAKKVLKGVFFTHQNQNISQKWLKFKYVVQF